MRRILAAIMMLAAVLSGCSRTDEDPVRTRGVAIREIADPAERAAAARAFLREHPTADAEVLGRVAIDLLDSVNDLRGRDVAIASADSMLAEGLPDYARFSVEGFLTIELLRTEVPENIARAGEISRRLLGEDVDHPDGYADMAAQQLRTVRSLGRDGDPWLALDLAIKGVEKADDQWRGYAASVLGYAYRSLLGMIEEDRGEDAVRSVADSLLAATDHPDATAELRGRLYHMTVDDDPDAAVAIAEAIGSTAAEIGSGNVLNGVAYDLAERDLAPGLAVALGERALELATGRRDSVYVLDTVGWAHHKAGDHDEAASHLRLALDLMDEDPTYEDELLQHLLTVYDAAGNLDGSIDLLVGVAARSLDDEAVAELTSKLTARDGNAGALDDLLEQHRYEGVRAAPAFTLADESGRTFALADLEGRISLLCFWSYG